MLTPATISLTVTKPSPLQSPKHGPGAGEDRRVGVRDGVGPLVRLVAVRLGDGVAVRGWVGVYVGEAGGSHPNADAEIWKVPTPP